MDSPKDWKHSQRELADLPQRVLDHLLEGCQVISRDYRYLYVNDAAAQQARCRKDALLGRRMMDCFPGIEKTNMFSVLQRCMNEGRSDALENEFTYADGLKAWFELRFEPIPEGVVILSMNITDRKNNEATLSKSVRSLSILKRYNQTLVRSTHEERLIQDICALVLEYGGYSYVRIQLQDDPSIHPSARYSLRPPPVPEGTTESADESFVQFEFEANGEIIGTLTASSAAPNAFGPDEIGFLEEVTEGLGYAIHNLRTRAASATS